MEYIKRIFNRRSRRNRGPTRNQSETVSVVETQFSQIETFVPGRWVEREGYESVQDIRGNVWGTTLTPIIKRDDVCIKINPHRGGKNIICGGESKKSRAKRRKKLRRGLPY